MFIMVAWQATIRRPKINTEVTMNKQLLVELQLYIERYKVEDIIREADARDDYIMPMRGFAILDKTHQDKALSKATKTDDNIWLEQFRKKPMPSKEEQEEAI